MDRVRRFDAVGIALLILVAGTILGISQLRFIARDEGFYLYASRLILDGQIPYRDFFLPQMPLMPYLYAAWFWFTGTSWISARIFAAGIGMACAVLIYLCAKHMYGTRSARVSLVLFGVTAAVQVWLPLAKNSGVAALFFLLALYLSLVRNRHLLAGICMGLCILSRLTFAPLLLLLFIPRSRSVAVHQVIRVCIGLMPAALILAWFYLQSPENFWLNNVTYHFQRTRLTEEGIAGNKRHIFLSLIGVNYCVGGGGRQFAILLAAAIASFWIVPRARFEHLMLLTAAFFFFGLHFLPSPTYVQYFLVVALLMVAPAGHVIVSIADAIAARWRYKPLSGLSIAACILFFGWLGSLDFYRFIVSGEKVIGVGILHRDSWKLHVAGEVAREIDKHNPQMKPVYSSWPGYLLEAKSVALAGTENNFGVGWANNQRITGESALRYRVLGRHAIFKAFNDGTIDVAALITGEGRRTLLGDALAGQGIRAIEPIPDVTVYLRTVPSEH